MSKTVTLRQSRSERGSQYLSATLASNGDLKIEGQDLGKQVEGFWGSGYSEYEYEITILSSDVPSLLKIFGVKGDILSALKAHYSSPDAIGIKSILDKNNIRYEFWSRVGD